MTLVQGKTNRGFTLIELLVVIAIIGILASLVFASLNVARSKARDVSRKVALKTLEKALELYFLDHNAYPSTGQPLSRAFKHNDYWRGLCDDCHHPSTSSEVSFRAESDTNGYIPGLAPKYISVLPVDPSGITTGFSGYIYISDGAQYKLLSHPTGPESYTYPGSVFYDANYPSLAEPGASSVFMVCRGAVACRTW